MLTVAKMGGGRERYYTGLAKEDYYVGGELSALESAGVWLCRGAERLGIEGTKVESEMFRNLFRGFSPDGSQKWVQNAGRFEKGERDRMPGFDLTYGLPKSVSIAYVLGGQETRKKIERAARGAITKNLGEIEKGCIVRSGKGGKFREEAGIIAGIFQHATARQVDKETPPDMHVHYHVTVINTGLTATGKTGALQGRTFLDKEGAFAKEWGGKFRDDFERGLQREGFETVKTKDAFELKGIPKEAIEYFSKRTAKIEELAPKDSHSYREQKQINIKSRVAKGEYDAAALERHWKKEALQYGLTPAVINGLWRNGEGKKEERNEPAQVHDLSARRDLLSVSQKQRKAELEPQRANKEYEKQKEARKAQKLDALREMKREYEREGLRVIGCTFKKVDAEEMTNAGVKSYTVARLWEDVRKETELEKVIKKARGEKTKTEWEKEKTKIREDLKPSSKSYHEFLYATYQISRKQRDFLNAELARDERKIDKNTVVMIYGGGRLKDNPTIQQLVREIEKRGGRVAITDPYAVKSQETARDAVKQQEAEHARDERERARVRGL